MLNETSDGDNYRAQPTGPDDNLSTGYNERGQRVMSLPTGTPPSSEREEERNTTITLRSKAQVWSELNKHLEATRRVLTRELKVTPEADRGKLIRKHMTSTSNVLADHVWAMLRAEAQGRLDWKAK